MKNYLLIGNGLNQCLNSGIAWNRLLKKVADDLSVSYCDKNPFPMEFEKIINEYLKSTSPKEDIYTVAKTLIADQIKTCSLPNNAVHYSLSQLNIDGILTTNYDFLLEKVYDGSFEQTQTKQKYLFTKTSTCGGKDFYHLHGHIAGIHSICLGYEHYSGILMNLRDSINRKENNERAKMRILQILNGSISPQETWGELFYISNIDIIGLGLYESEMDLWWLLTHRAFLINTDYEGAKSKIKNVITFHAIFDYDMHNSETEVDVKQRIDELKRRNNLLETLCVRIRVYEVGSDKANRTYSDAYKQIVREIENRLAGKANR